jgi:hypothetical protein
MCNLVKTRALLCSSCTGIRAKRLEMQVHGRLTELADMGKIPYFTRWNQVYAGNYRPDFVWEFAERTVILEVDERGHVGYDKKREAQRDQCIKEKGPSRVFRIKAFAELEEFISELS